MKIGFIPIDNRPVCYTLPKLISQIDGSLDLLLPEREFLGDLHKNADYEELLSWIENLKEPDALVISLDTVAYGGLIPSRRCTEGIEAITLRLNRLKKVLSGKKVYAFSSIMRISDNNINEEEKEYWDKWGKKIFEYSQYFHKYAKPPKHDIPSAILEDYLNTRKRNFEINKIYLKWQQEGLFDTLIFSKDDCAEYGLNVQEADALKSLGAIVKTGADEIPLTLLARAIGGNVKINPVFLEPSQKHLISNYEDISIADTVKSQIELAGCEISEISDAEIFVNNFIQKQGEIVMKVPTAPFDGCWHQPEKPYAVADVRFANGADNSFVKALFPAGLGETFLGYSAWNTSANTLGGLILGLKMTLNAKKKNTFNKNAFNKLMLTRFLDDWAYQANVRQQLDCVDTTALAEKMRVFEKFLFEKFPYNGKIMYSFPWKRLFEVEIDFS